MTSNGALTTDIDSCGEVKQMGSGNGHLRIGVYVCYRGPNIAATVDVKAVAEYAARLPGVAVGGCCGLTRSPWILGSERA